MSLPRSSSNSELLIEPPGTFASAVFCALASGTLACAFNAVCDSPAAARVGAEHAANSPRVSNERVTSLVFMTYLTLAAANLFGPHFADDSLACEADPSSLPGLRHTPSALSTPRGRNTGRLVAAQLEVLPGHHRCDNRVEGGEYDNCNLVPEGRTVQL